MNFDQTPEFSKELKKFSKKWRSLPSDIIVLQDVLSTLYKGANGLSAKHIRESFFNTKRGTVLQIISDKCEVVKVRVDCIDLNKDMLRVTFINFKDTIIFIELYAKKDKAREDNNRIQKYLKIVMQSE